MSRYRLEGRKVRDEGNPDFCVDIRALIDSSSDEFNRCHLSASERLSIISDLGECQVLDVLSKVYADKGRQFVGGVDGAWDLQRLKSMALKEPVKA